MHHRRCLAIILCILQQLLLLLIAASVRPPCPVRLPCRCTDVRIKCVQPDQPTAARHYLARVPYFAPLANQRDIRWQFGYHELRVRGQAMTNLSLRYDWGLLRVVRVEVTESLVRSLAPDAFRGLHGIESLNLSHNLLTSIGQRELEGLVSLRELVLHGNRIKTLQPGVFSETPGLTKLYLSDNQLDEVPSDLRRLTGLRHLYLQRNNFSQLPDFAFDGLRRLIILDLGGQRPGLDIRPYAFCGLSTGVDEEQSDSVRSGGLVALFLRDNWLPRLDLCALGRVRTLRGLNMSGSRFPCDCQAARLMSAAVGEAGGADWTEIYGFAPRFVGYDFGAAGQPDCLSIASRCSRESAACPPEAACPAGAASLSLKPSAARQDPQLAPSILPAGAFNWERQRWRIDSNDGQLVQQLNAAGKDRPLRLMLLLMLLLLLS